MPTDKFDLPGGGPAFPMQDMQAIHAYAHAQVIGIEDSKENDRVYTLARAAAVGGMTKRELFAKDAMAAMLGSPDSPEHEPTMAALFRDRTLMLDYVELAYDIADAMVKAGRE
jgi:hypothetical protein